MLSALVAWPLIHIILLYKKIYPLSAFLQTMSFIQNTKATPIHPRRRTFGRTILPTTSARFACRAVRFIVCRVRHGKRIFSDDVFSPNPFVVLANGRGLDCGLGLVSRAVARRLGRVGSQSGFRVGLLWNLRRFRHQPGLVHTRTQLIDRGSWVASGGTDVLPSKINQSVINSLIVSI